MHCGWLLFIAASFVLGLSCMRFSMRRLSIEYVIFSLISGITFAVWIAYIIALLRRSVDDITISATVILCIFLSLLLHKSQNISQREKSVEVLKDMLHGTSRISIIIIIIIIIFITIYAVIMNLYCVLRPENGDLYAMYSVWGDYPFHASVITSFVYGNNFPPVYPQFIGKPMHYPVIVDFLSAVLMCGGLDLRASILLPNIILQICMFCSFFFLARSLSSDYIAAISTLLLIFGGYPPDITPAGHPIQIQFLNAVYAVFLPQRSALLGFSISFLIYMLLASDAPQQRNKLIAGTLAGTLPLIHAHSFIVVSFVSAFLVFFRVLSSISSVPSSLSPGSIASFASFFISSLKREAIMFAPLLALSVPQVLAIRSQVSGDFFSFYPGWTDANARAITHLDWSNPVSAFISSCVALLIMVGFWGLNLNLLAFLIPIGFLRAKTKIFYTPFFIIFIIANLIKFQPWWWDNYKILLHWYAISTILAASAIVFIYKISMNNAPTGERKENRTIAESRRGALICAALICAVLLMITTISGIATHIYMFENQAVLWTKDDFELASWIIENTPPESVFLTAGGYSAHNHPVPALAGRRIPLGYMGWLWSHGFNWSELQKTERDLTEMFRGNESLLSKYDIDYICVGPFEEDFARKKGFSINISGCKLIYDRNFSTGRWQIYIRN